MSVPFFPGRCDLFSKWGIARDVACEIEAIEHNINLRMYSYTTDPFVWNF